MKQKQNTGKRAELQRQNSPELLLTDFLGAVVSDHRIGPFHISLYAGILKLWSDVGFKNPFNMFGHQLMPICKIHGLSTYHSKLKELHEQGYIVYTPSFNHHKGSKILLRNIGKHKNRH